MTSQRKRPGIRNMERRISALFLLIVACVIVSQQPLSLAKAGGDSSTIHGWLEEEGAPSSQTAMVLVVAVDTAQPVDLDVYAPDEAVDWINRLPTERNGPGLVRTSPSAGYAVTGLTPGTYLVGTTASFSPYGGILPPVEIQTLIGGRPSSMYAFEFTLEADSTLMVNFELGSQYPDAPGRFEVCAFTYDRVTLEQGLPDRVAHATIAPVNDDVDASAITISINDAGCALFESIPPADYVIAVETEGGFTFTQDITIVGGHDGRLELSAGPPIADGLVAPNLPDSGSGGEPQTSGSAALFSIGYLVMVATLAVAASSMIRAGTR